MIASVAGSLVLNPAKVIIRKAKGKRTQLLFADALYISFFAETADLLVYLENITEQVRLIDSEQNAREL